jgi:Domain of unknown function (DUF5916)/Carbohydrate family 9 binding domain-like
MFGWAGPVPCRGRFGVSIAAIILTLITASPVLASPQSAAEKAPDPAAPRPSLRSHRLTQPPAIDGVLDDEAWQDGSVETGEWLSYNPLFGSSVPQKTTVWIGHDPNFLYFAFQCDDPEPSNVKTSITRRDNIWSDDWVGISLDALGTGQISYHLMVNPNGVQLDMLNTVAGGEDQSPDFVWDSAGRRNAQGYAVEMRVPLQTIRFKGGSDVDMGILFWRRVSRAGISVAWPPLEPGKWVFEKHASLAFDELRPRLIREVIPSTTYSRTERRAAPASWGRADNQGDVGVSGKYGITSTVTLDATVNPDFSQVESDAFQVEVNQRFPIFFSEKRPFFMEGSGIFTLAGQGNDNSLQAAVHTRRIIDPAFGAKVTGSLGRWAFGTLTALDQAAGRNLPDGDPGIGRDRLFNIARAQYTLGPSNYVGALAVDTEFADGYNRVVGADLSYRVNATQRVSGFVLGSSSRSPGGRESTSGLGAQAGYEYSTKRLNLAGYAEHYDRDFQMDTAFINRVGITSAWGYGEYNFYPPSTKQWLLKLSPFSFTQGGHDENAGGNELLQVTGVRLQFSRQGSFRFDRFDGFEAWAGQRFDRGRWRMFGGVQLYRWLNVDGQYFFGDAVFYDPVDPYQGRSIDGRIGFTLQPSGRLSQGLEYRRTSFDRASTGERVYDVDLIYSRTTYQFSRQFFVRAIAQFDSSRHQVLTDFLASYELRPGTVVYAGYGSLIEQRGFHDGEWITGEGNYAASQRGLFFKASYLFRF